MNAFWSIFWFCWSLLGAVAAGLLTLFFGAWGLGNLFDECDWAEGFFLVVVALGCATGLFAIIAGWGSGAIHP